jgi:DNA-binding HxlR family transcriptional regulator
MQLNRWSERHVYYTLTGVGQDLESIRHLARQWLDKGAECARPESVAGL